MEKSVAATNHKVSTYIPDDLAFPILSRLPLKSLKRFGCVRRSWALLFENPHFMSMFCNNFISNSRSSYDDTSLLLHLFDKWELYSLPGERFENMVKLDWPKPFPRRNLRFKFFGSYSVDGILCLHEYQRRVGLWNPATDELKVIPLSPIELSLGDDAMRNLHGFGYDCVRDDYKLISHVRLHPKISLDPFWEIYSLRSNLWKKLDIDMPLSYGTLEHVRVYMDGVCHWLYEDSKHEYVGACLVSFDLSNEAFFSTPISYDPKAWTHLAELNGSIALFQYHRQMTTFHISILGELGVKESWTKLFIIGPLPCIEHLIGVGKNGEIFFRKKDKELAWFDLNTKMIEELGLKVNGRFYGHVHIYKDNLVIYKKNLLRIGGISN